MLASAYQDGVGVHQDYVEALKWWSIEAGDDQQRYADAREAFARKMTTAEIAEAQKRAREWTEAFTKRQPK